jgi:hypothetical protein
MPPSIKVLIACLITISLSLGIVLAIQVKNVRDANLSMINSLPNKASSTPTETSTSNDKENVILSDYCFSNYYSLAENLESKMRANLWYDGKSLSKLFSSSEFKKIEQGAQKLSYQSPMELCNFEDDFIAFVSFGDYSADNNNTIGFYDVREDKLSTIELYNRGSGDIGLCEINGLITDGLLVSCAGGDGPGGYSTEYIWNVEKQKVTVIKDCEYFQEDETCTMDRFKF